jgi:hypothetical protein
MMFNKRLAKSKLHSCGPAQNVPQARKVSPRRPEFPDWHRRGFDLRRVARAIPWTQLYTEDIAAEFAPLTARGVASRGEPRRMGPTRFADFDDTCGNLIRLVES